ncbi:MAG: transcriptional regulator [Dyadobacter sp. 50-39]|uniref:helix-turn-helix domain-containing protein n=1 Tax=Dyadobacter sp. 50-39 TaxID=1895756 RepID=UPI0009638CCC|nr:helix-turn-helix domain-containing protein [Dyadobacter sp. 50-39]OJV21296.1 MAG: transcriptional regulator [Dyadobacter sp. 50-39]
METLRYKVIRNLEQYNNYCNELIAMLESENPDQYEEEIDLLTVLIEHYDAEHSTIRGDADPVELLKLLMKDHRMKAKDLAELLNVSKGYVSEMLNYKKGMSKEVIRKLATRFAMRQEAFNRPYRLEGERMMEEEEDAVAKETVSL